MCKFWKPDTVLLNLGKPWMLDTVPSKPTPALLWVTLVLVSVLVPLWLQCGPLLPPRSLHLHLHLAPAPCVPLPRVWRPGEGRSDQWQWSPGWAQ